MQGRRSGSVVGKDNAESLKQGSKIFNSITKTIHFARLLYCRYIIYLWCTECSLCRSNGRGVEEVEGGWRGLDGRRGWGGRGWRVRCLGEAEGMHLTD